MKSSEKHSQQLTCPECGEVLITASDHVGCSNCDHLWPVRNGIPRFSDDDIYWGEIPENLMDDIVNDAKRIGWQCSTKRHLEKDYPSLIDYVLNETRADWRYLIPIEKEFDILDLGAGWGLISSVLAQHCNSVIALEKIEPRVEFLNTRFQQDGVKNISIIQGDVMNLPFPENSFDCIVCNGVLEWVGLFDHSRSPREAQIFFLKKLVKILKPEGYLYVGIENRFSYKQLLGVRDHSGLRFTSVVPRFLANWITMWFNRGNIFFLANEARGYRTYTYTASGYQKLLKKGGFNKMTLYYAFPGYNYPRWLIPSDQLNAYKFFLQNLLLPRSKFGRFAQKIAGLSLFDKSHRLVVPDFCMIVQK